MRPIYAAPLPIFPFPNTTLPTRANRRGCSLALYGFRASYLHPSMLRIEFLSVTAGKHVERRTGVTFEIDRARRVLVCEPIRRNEVGYEDAADIIAILIILDGIGDLAGPKGALRVLVRAVEPWVDGHFNEFVRGADADALIGGKNGFDEDLRNWRVLS